MTADAETILLNKITKVLGDLQEQGARDGEAMFMLGAGADYLCTSADAASWSDLKSKLSATETLGLLAQVDAEGQAAVARDQIKHAYALQILGLSVAAIDAQRPDTRAATRLIDDLIASALTNYRQYAAKGAPTRN